MKKNLILKVLIALTLTQNVLSSSQPVQASSTISLEDANLVSTWTETLDELYDWHLDGEWTKEELQPIFKAAWSLQNSIEDTTGESGQTWMKENIGTITFHHQTVFNTLLKSHFVLPGGNIYLYHKHSNTTFTPEDILHEIAHVLDNHQSASEMSTFTGGGPSEQMVRDVNGNPDACWVKMFCPLGYQKWVAGPESWEDGEYGNWSVADDFAETFSWSVFEPEKVPSTRLTWMNEYFQSTVSE